MKILIIGATGNSGQHLVKAGLRAGHEVTAYIRSRDKLTGQLGEDLVARLQIAEGTVQDYSNLVTAMTGQDAVINAAGNAMDGEGYVPLVRTVVKAAEQALGAGGRLWLFGGAAALDVPGTNRMTVDLPKVPAIFRAHKTNYETVSATGLDWSMLCPGPMIDSKNGKPHEGLRLSANEWPFPKPAVSKFLPGIALALAFKLKMPQMVITYEDAAKVILDNLAPRGDFSCKRVGVALPVGLTGKKDFEMPTT